MRTLKTTEEVINELGAKTVQQVTGRKRTAVYNWTKRDTFPPDTYVVLQKVLADKNHRAPASLWRMPVEPYQQAAE